MLTIEKNNTSTLEERVAQWAEELASAVTENYKKDSIRLHESSLRDEMHYSPYHVDQLAEIAAGTAKLNRFVTYTGRKYIRIVMQEWQDDSKYGRIDPREAGYYDSSIHAFIDKKTGQVYMPAGYKKPTLTGKNPVRFDLRIIKDREYVLNPVNCCWAGGYLYDRSHLPSKYI